jgi:predicted transcriptional regulator of viral defense system
MEYSILSKLRKKNYFTIQDVAKVCNIKPESAQVLCSRYVKKGIFIRLKKNFYILEQSWENFSREDFFKISNFLQVPSYISFTTAMSFYGVTTQVLRDFYESACLKRSVKFNERGVSFNFFKLKKRYYFGFVKKRDFFIATKEKAFIDGIYLYSFGKYKLDFSSIDIDVLDKKKILENVEAFPLKTVDLVRKLCKI